MGIMTRCIEILAVFGSFLIIIFTMPFSLCVIFKVVQEYERAVVFRMGRLKGEPQGPGKLLIISIRNEYNKVELFK
jgi:erythrocyte band 7 integral membrane protein